MPESRFRDFRVLLSMNHWATCEAPPVRSIESATLCRFFFDGSSWHEPDGPETGLTTSPSTEAGKSKLWFGGRFVLAVRDCCFRCFESSSRVGSVAERLGSRAAAAAESKRTLGNRVASAVPINRRHIITMDHLDRCHLDVLRHCPCHRNNLAHTEQARTVSPSGTIRPGQFGWIRHWFGGVAQRPGLRARALRRDAGTLSQTRQSGLALGSRKRRICVRDSGS